MKNEILKYKAWLHRSGAIYIQCLACGALHQPGQFPTNDCSACALIVKNEIVAEENEKHINEIRDSHKQIIGVTKVVCEHEAMTYGMEFNYHTRVGYIESEGKQTI